MAKSNKVLTVDITNESITVIEVTPSMKKQTMIHNALIFETPEDAYEDGMVKDPERIASAIREQLNANGITNKNVIFVMTSAKVVNREVLIPEVKENKVKGIVAANASEYFPVNIEDYVVSHSVLEHVVGDDKQKQIKLMVVAAPMAMVKGYYELGSLLGVNVQSIDYVGNAMLQLIKTQTSSSSTTMVIQLGSESTILNIVRGNTLLLQRTVPYGTNNVVQEVMDEKGVDATTAMSLLQNERLITVDFDDNPITGEFRYLVTNIGRVIDYYVTKYPDTPIDDVYLTGDGALIRGIDGLFKIQLNIQTRIMDSLYNVKFAPQIDTKIYNPVYLISAIGAAYDPMGFNISEVKRSKAAGVDYTGSFIAAGVVFAVIGLGVCAVSMVMKNASQQKRDNLNAQIMQIQDIDQIISAYDSAKAKYEDIEIMYDQTRSLNENAVMFINALEENQPKDMLISDYKSGADKVTMTGVSGSYDSIAKLAIQLKKMDCVENAFIEKIDEETDNESGKVTFNFSLRCNFVSMVEEETEDEMDSEAGEATLQAE